MAGNFDTFENLDPDDISLNRDHIQTCKNVYELVNVSEQFMATVRFIIQRVMANEYVNLECYQIGQLSELGAGFNSRQSNNPNYVRFDFITCMYGSSLSLWLENETLRWLGACDGEYITVDFPYITYSDRKIQAKILDNIVKKMWLGG